jgi:hypothetical protein
MNDLKQPILIGAFCGAFTVILMMLYHFFFNYRSSTVMGYVIGVGLGLVVGAIGFGVTYAITRSR